MNKKIKLYLLRLILKYSLIIGMNWILRMPTSVIQLKVITNIICTQISFRTLKNSSFVTLLKMTAKDS